MELPDYPLSEWQWLALLAGTATLDRALRQAREKGVSLSAPQRYLLELACLASVSQGMRLLAGHAECERLCAVIRADSDGTEVRS